MRRRDALSFLVAIFVAVHVGFFLGKIDGDRYTSLIASILMYLAPSPLVVGDFRFLEGKENEE